MFVGEITSPDFAWNSVSSSLNATIKTLEVYIYQITDYEGDPFCNTIIDMYKKGINVTVLVSNKIFDEADQESADDCYYKLYDAYVPVRVTAYDMYTYSHQKYWIIDGEVAVVSTGNWGQSDFPPGSNSYPPFIDPGWRLINRDFSIALTDPSLVGYLKTVLQEDWSRGSNWSPDSLKRSPRTRH